MSKKEMSEEKKEKTWRRLKKAFVVMAILYIILFIVKDYLDKKPSRDITIYNKVGSSVSATSLSIKDSLIIKEYSIVRFKDYLKALNFESAYKITSEEYRAFKTYEEFVEEFSNINYDSIELKEIRAKSNFAFEAEVVYQNNVGTKFETIYMIYPSLFSETEYTISPNGFLYAYKDKDYEEDGIKVHINNCVAYVDKITIKGNIENVSWFDNVEIDRVGASYNTSLKKWTDYRINLQKGQNIGFEVLIGNTNYFIPNKLLLKRQKGDVERTYVIDLDKK